jgi:hypothetical protein
MTTGDAGPRIVLDEDVPPDLANHLRARGLDAIAINELRDSIWPHQESVSDDDVCRELSTRPSVLVTLNVRDYADIAFLTRLSEEYGVSVVVVRVPKAEARASKRPQAIRDIVHRHAHRIGPLVAGEPTVVSANRVGFRRRPLSEILPKLETPSP